MTMNAWQTGCWNWLRARFAAATDQRPRRRRLRQTHFSTVAALVEEFESRLLLTVTYQGGALLTHVDSQAVYLGSDWNSSASLQTQKGQLEQFNSTVVQSSYMDMLTNAGYGVGRGTSVAGAVDNITLNKTTGITDAQIQSDIQAMINAGQLHAPDANGLYIVYVEPGVVIKTSFGASNTAFLGYHGAFAGHTAAGMAADIHYAVIAYPGAPNFSSSSQGFSSNLNELTAVTSHELAEAVTDPNVNYKAMGWYDFQNNGEIGDLAVGHYAVLSGYQVQDMVNQNDQIIAPGTTQPPPSSGLTAPVVTATALSATTGQLSWGGVAGAQGYKIFQMNGSQKVLIGTFGASTTLVNLSGLSAHSTYSFVVEAYNSTTTADSQVVSLTTPSAPQTLWAPHLTATALSSTSVQLNWTGVWGAQGYRVYWSSGSQVYLLGTVNAFTTSVTITGLQPGTASSFLIEAYSGTSIGDSSWVSVTTPAARAGDLASLWSALSGADTHCQRTPMLWFA
jgi:hypothetical protein